MTTPDPLGPTFDLGLKADGLTRTAINAIRVATGISGVAAIVLGILLLFFTGQTIVAAAWLFGIYFLISGIIRVGTGIFASRVGGGMRALHIILGVLLIIGGVIAIKNVGLAVTVLLVMLVAIVGVGWIIEGIIALAEAGNAPSKGVAIALGILSIVAGLVVLFLPGTSALLLIIFGAIALIVLGIAQLARAFTFGREALKASGTGAPSTAPPAA